MIQGAKLLSGDIDTAISLADGHPRLNYLLVQIPSIEIPPTTSQRAELAQFVSKNLRSKDLNTYDDARKAYKFLVGKGWWASPAK